MGHLFYATSSFVHHFVPIGEFKLELQSGNAQFRSKSTIFLAVWPRNFTNDPQKQWGTSSMLLQTLCIISYLLELQSANTQFGWISAIFCPMWPWNLTDDLENNITAFSMLLQICASFHSLQWNQAGVTVRKRSIRVKIDNFFSCVT